MHVFTSSQEAFQEPNLSKLGEGLMGSGSGGASASAGEAGSAGGSTVCPGLGQGLEG